MDTAQWTQEKMEDKVSNTSWSLANTSSNKNNSNSKVGSRCLERKIRRKEEEGAKCPRCNSSNTKFCYYNNYSLTQPRYFCKACKRYWTAGGSLRNIPVGGRKNKRSSSFSSSPSPSSKRISSHDLVAAAQSQYNNNQDLNLGFPISQHLNQQFTTLSEFIHLPTPPNNNPKGEQASTTNNYHHLSGLELFIPDPKNNNEGEYSSGYPSLQDYSRPTLNFSLEQGRHVDNNNVVGRLLFPFQDLKQVSTTTTIIDHDNTITTTSTSNINNSKTNEEDEIRNDDDGESTNGYWSGMLDAGGSW